MKLLGKGIDELSKNDIDRLIENSIPENTKLDYKLLLKVDGSSDKKEFLADISSFCNSEGGVLLFGIKEKKDEQGKNTGIPELVVPLKDYNKDLLIQKIENIIRDGLNPSLNNIKLNFIKYETGIVLAIGIPKNYGLPKMVILGSSNKFYKRRNSGKYLLDVYELNSEFLKFDKMNRLLDEFHRQRLTEIENLKIIPNLRQDRIFLFTSFPIEKESINLVLINKTELNELAKILRPIHSTGWRVRHNLEGFLVYDEGLEDNHQLVHSYSQLFRDGTIEFFTSMNHFKNDQRSNNIDINGNCTETAIDEAITNTINAFDYLNLETTFYIKCTITGLTNGMIVNEKYPMFGSILSRGGLIQREKIEFPGFIINSQNIEEVKIQIKDTLWQCGGLTHSPLKGN